VALGTHSATYRQVPLTVGAPAAPNTPATTGGSSSDSGSSTQPRTVLNLPPSLVEPLRRVAFARAWVQQPAEATQQQGTRPAAFDAASSAAGDPAGDLVDSGGYAGKRAGSEEANRYYSPQKQQPQKQKQRQVPRREPSATIAPVSWSANVTSTVR